MRWHRIERGRYVLFFGEDYGDGQIKFEFSRKHNFGLGFKVRREERDLGFSIIGWKLFNFWVTVESKRLKYVDDITLFGLSWLTREHVIRAQIMDYSEMDSSKPAILSTYWNYRDWLLGRPIYSESRHERPNVVDMALPERTYRVNLDFYTSYWHRPRSPFTRSVKRVTLTPDTPVPIPGKGENSWDCNEDAIHNSTMPTGDRSASEIVEDFKKEVLDTRERRASRDWIPESKVS